MGTHSLHSWVCNCSRESGEEGGGGGGGRGRRTDKTACILRAGCDSDECESCMRFAYRLRRALAFIAVHAEVSGAAKAVASS